MSLRIAGLVRLLQLASPSLPIGGYSYSQGLEWAIEAKMVGDAATAERWIGDAMQHAIACADAAVAARALAAVRAPDESAFAQWNAWFRASRETRELRAETEQMGSSLLSLARDLGWIDAGAHAWAARAAPVTLPAAFALAARDIDCDVETALAAYVFAWLENQVLVTVKALPLGQVAGQRMLARLAARIGDVAHSAATLADDDVASFAPGLAIASTFHETQYSRLFRS
jgi:urease accessory protein